MGQMSVIFVVAALLTGSLLLLNARGATQEARDSASRYHVDQFGREVATVGLERVAGRLAAEPDLWDTLATAGGATYFDIPTTTYETDIVHGTYAVEVTDYTGTEPDPFTTVVTDPERVSVLATGTFQGTPYQIRATYEKGWTDIGLPPGFRYSIITDGDFTGGQSSDVRGVDPAANAAVHANGSMNCGGGSGRFKGYGTFTTPGGSCSAFESYFDPATATGEDEVSQSDSVLIPPFNPEDYRPSLPVPAGVRYDAGGFTAPNGTTTVGSSAYGPDNPFLWFIDGNLSIAGNKHIVLDGHVLIVVTGSVTTSGRASISSGSAPPRANNVNQNHLNAWAAANLAQPGNFSKVSIYSGGNMLINGTGSKVANLFTNGSASINGGGNAFNFVGSVVTRQDLTLTGNNKILYAGLPESNLLPGLRYLVPTGLRLVDYSEWPTP